MDIVYIMIFVLTAVNAQPEFEKVFKQNVNTLTRDILFNPDMGSDIEEVEDAVTLSLSGDIKRWIDSAIAKITDPVEFNNRTVVIMLSEDVSIVSSRFGVRLSGQSDIVTDTLRVRSLNVFYRRVTYKLVIPEIVFNIDSLFSVLNIMGIKFNLHLYGQVIVNNSVLEGRATVRYLTKKLTDLTANVKFGTFHSTLVGDVNGIDVTSFLNSLATEILPQVLEKRIDDINQAVADSIWAQF